MEKSKNSKTMPESLVASVSSSVLDFTPNNLSHIFKNIKHKPCSVIGYDFAWDINKTEKFIGELFYSNDDK